MRMHHTRRTLLITAAASALSACGFQLRGESRFAFDTLHATFEPKSSLGNEFKRTVAAGSNTRVVDAPLDAQVVMEVLSDTREKVVLGTTATGQTREFQLRLRLRFKLRSAAGKELIAPTELVLTRDVSFNESAVLAKEGEEVLLYRTMQTDMVAQVMRRLAAVKSL
jgi:LPS-assembly lipoprotein